MNNKRNILFLDIDDTILSSDNIYIYITYKNGISKKLTTYEFSKMKENKLKVLKIDYSEFNNPEKIKNSIIYGKPLYQNLKIIENYINNGWEIGILTARGQEKIIKNIIYKWLNKYININFKIFKKDIYAISDEKKNYEGINSSMKKINILKKYYYNDSYNRICLIDDSQKTINYIKKINKKENINIEYIKVENNYKENIN